MHQFLASLCQKLQLGENISKEKQMTLQGHHCSLITPGFVCVSPSTCVSLLHTCVSLCGSEREAIMQMTAVVPARHNVDTSATLPTLPTCSSVFTLTLLFYPSGWPLTCSSHNSLSSGRTGSGDGWQKAQQCLSLRPALLCFICPELRV